jgi:hypothetical protein
LRLLPEPLYRSAMTRDFAAEVTSLEKQVNTNADAVYGLRALEEAWARHLLGVAPSGDIVKLVHHRAQRAFDTATTTGATAAFEALEHLTTAEQWQWRIGSYATGSGEGLASMAEVRALQMARAWLAAALFRETHAPALSALATSLAVEIERDPNGMGARYSKAITHLRAWLEN